MKKSIYCFIVGIWALFSQAQQNQIIQGEYFWDNDPGEGNAITLMAANGNFDSILENILQNTVSVPATPGLHIFGIRIKDNTGIWGPVLKNVIHIGNSTTTNYVTLSQAEYFWDTDPGEGNANSLLATDSNFDSVLENIIQNTASIPTTLGLHTFGIRLKDNTGAWGSVFKNVIHIGNSTTVNYDIVTQAEYFWDTDPGEGNANALSATDGSFDSIIESILQNDVSLINPVGLHVFNVRVKDNQGVWGPVFKNVIYIETTLSVNPVATADHYYFYPNPASNIIRFNKEIEKVEIYDLNGRFISTSVTNEVTISDLTTGTYLLKVTTPEGLTFTKKMIKR